MASLPPSPEVSDASHPVLHTAYPSTSEKGPRCFPSPPTSEQFTVVTEGDMGAMRSTDRSRE